MLHIVQRVRVNFATNQSFRIETLFKDLYGMGFSVLLDKKITGRNGMVGRLNLRTFLVKLTHNSVTR